MTRYDSTSTHDRAIHTPSPGHELPATVRGGLARCATTGSRAASDRAVQSRRLQRRGAGTRQLRTARAQCKVRSGHVDPFGELQVPITPAGAPMSGEVDHE